jgi:Kdo2-lipid IVA lauroyltransferase/acyltransferase
MCLATARGVSRSPLAWRWQLARALGRLYLHGDARMNELLQVNLRIAYPRLDHSAMLRLVQDNAHETFFAFIDRFRCWQLSEADVRATVQFDGAAHLHAAMRSGPTVLLAPHFVHFEAGVQRLALEGSMMTLFQPSRHAAFEALRSVARSRFNAQHLVPVGTPLAALVRKLRAGTPLFLLPDVDAGASGTFTPFLGEVASTPRTAAWCAERIGARLLPFTVRRTDADRYVATVHAPLSGLTGDIDGDTARINAVLERLIRHEPQQYWWSQARFLTRPAGAAAVYSPRIQSMLAAR